MKIRLDIKKKILILYEIADELRKGKDFKITRLTRIKSLCEDDDAAEKFALFILKEKLNQSLEKDIDNKENCNFLKNVISAIESYFDDKNEITKNELFSLLADSKSKNDEYRKISWNIIRIIENSEAFYSELTLGCILYNNRSSDLAYQLAREYTERYNSRYGTGLLPESAPFVEKIADFWNSYYFK